MSNTCPLVLCTLRNYAYYATTQNLYALCIPFITSRASFKRSTGVPFLLAASTLARELPRPRIPHLSRRTRSHSYTLFLSLLRDNYALYEFVCKQNYFEDRSGSFYATIVSSNYEFDCTV